MNNLKQKSILLLVLATPLAWADVRAVHVGERVADSVNSLQELMAVPDRSAPLDLMRAATCIATVQIYKAGFIFGAQGGSGLASCRDQAGRWGAPIFIRMGGMSWGLLLGIEKVDLTLIFTNHDASEGLAKTNLSLGATAGVTAGPVGRDLRAGTNFLLEDSIYSYSLAKGFYAGLALDGTFITRDERYNEATYGDRHAEDILALSQESIPMIVRPFVDELSRY